MRSILLVALLFAGLSPLAGCPATAQTPPAPEESQKAPPAPPEGAPSPFDSVFMPDAEPSAPEAPAPTSANPASPNVVPLRPRAVLRWWEDPTFDRRVSLVLKDADLNTAIDALGKASGMSLVASGGSKARKKVTLNLRAAPLRDVMLALANLYGLLWFRAGEVYVLTYISASTRRTYTPRRVRVVPAR